MMEQQTEAQIEDVSGIVLDTVWKVLVVLDDCRYGGGERYVLLHHCYTCLDLYITVVGVFICASLTGSDQPDDNSPARQVMTVPTQTNTPIQTPNPVVVIMNLYDFV